MIRPPLFSPVFVTNGVADEQLALSEGSAEIAAVMFGCLDFGGEGVVEKQVLKATIGGDAEVCLTERFHSRVHCSFTLHSVIRLP